MHHVLSNAIHYLNTDIVPKLYLDLVDSLVAYVHERIMLPEYMAFVLSVMIKQIELYRREGATLLRYERHIARRCPILPRFHAYY